MIKPIGGYFELDLPKFYNFPLNGGVRVNSGRNALEYILRSLGVNNIGTVYLPFYTCDVVLEPLQKMGINIGYYHIDENLEIDGVPDLGVYDYIIVNNYFGIKDKYVDQCVEKFGNKIIIDSSQALFYNISDGINIFYSPRKFVSLPDGGVAKANNVVELHETDISHDLCSHMLKRVDIGPEGGFLDFKSNSGKLKGRPLRLMSPLTERLISSIDFVSVCEIRKANYNILREALETSNLLITPTEDEISCPMVYPYLTKDPRLRKTLIENKVFVAKYWPNVLEWCKKDEIENNLTNNLLPLPIDQRYREEEMKRILEIIGSR